jgi:transcriptional regulator with XRE-family HTH domain
MTITDTKISATNKTNPPQDQKGLQPPEKKLDSCTFCHQTGLLLPPFSERVKEREVILELCEECYTLAGEDDNWLKQKLKEEFVKSSTGINDEKYEKLRAGINEKKYEKLRADSPLAQARKAQGLTCVELSRRANLDKSTIRKLEFNQIKSRLSTLVSLATALNIPVSELLYLKQDNSERKVRSKSGQKPKPKSRHLSKSQRERPIEAQPELKGGRLLEKLRLERNLTQVELANLCHTKRGIISRIENGDSVVKLSTIRQVAEYLGVSVADLAPERTIQMKLEG